MSPSSTRRTVIAAVTMVPLAGVKLSAVAQGDTKERANAALIRLLTARRPHVPDRDRERADQWVADWARFTTLLGQLDRSWDRYEPGAWTLQRSLGPLGVWSRYPETTSCAWWKHRRGLLMLYGRELPSVLDAFQQPLGVNPGWLRDFVAGGQTHRSLRADGVRWTVSRADAVRGPTTLRLAAAELLSCPVSPFTTGRSPA